MNEFDVILQKHDETIRNRFFIISEIIYKAAGVPLEAKIWAGLPSFYLNENFIRIIPFKDHINIEASAIKKYSNLLKEYKITPKGMLQIFNSEQIPFNALELIFKDSLYNK
jgi:hypothetical protein